MTDQAKLPTKEDIAKLPRWMRVALAVRCAQRVRPIYNEDHAEILDRAIDFAATGARTKAAYGKEVVEASAELSSRLARVSARMAAAAHSATFAASSAVKSCNAQFADGRDYYDFVGDGDRAPWDAHQRSLRDGRSAVDDVRSSMEWAIRALPGDGTIIVAIRADVASARNVATTKELTDGDAAAPGLLGPLWPNGAPDWWPRTESETSAFPTEEDIARLPRWMRVAFAVRCAQRVRPLYQGENGEAVDLAIRLSVRAAATANTGSMTEASLAAGRLAAGAVDDINVAASVVEAGDHERAETLVAPVMVVRAAQQAATSVSFCSNSDAFAAESAQAAAAAARAAAKADERARPLIVRDYELMLHRSSSPRWTDDTPAPPEAFGPLWPDGEPSWWPPQDDDDPEHPLTDKDLLELSVFDQVALAARCAQRVRPLCSPSHAEEVDRAIDLAMEVASTGVSSGSSVRAAAAASRRLDYAAVSGSAAREAYVFRTAWLAVAAAAAVKRKDAGEVAALVARAVRSAKAALAESATAARLDLERLSRHAADRSPGDVFTSPEYFGPLWPDGAPDWWEEPASPGAANGIADAPPLSLYFDLDEIAHDEVAEVIGLLSDLYRDEGGDRLVIDHQMLTSEVAVPEPVPAGDA